MFLSQLIDYYLKDKTIYYIKSRREAYIITKAVEAKVNSAILRAQLIADERKSADFKIFLYKLNEAQQVEDIFIYIYIYLFKLSYFYLI